MIAMFSGIVQGTAKLVDAQVTPHNFQIQLKADKPLFRNVSIGQSVAVNGVCLTATQADDYTFSAQVMTTTMNISNINPKYLTKDTAVNIETALKLGDSLDGHIVQGHVNGMGQIVTIHDRINSKLFEIKTDHQLLEEMIPKGSIAVNGVSLTIVDIFSDSFSVSLTNHSEQVTNFKDYQVGDIVNIETDFIGHQVNAYLKNKE